MRKSQVRRSARGRFPSCSTGHFSVSDCPGGKRPSLRICCSSFLRSLLSPKIIFVSSSGRNLLYMILSQVEAHCEDSSAGVPSAPRLLRKMPRSEEHTSELQSHVNLVCRLLLEKK